MSDSRLLSAERLAEIRDFLEAETWRYGDGFRVIVSVFQHIDALEEQLRSAKLEGAREVIRRWSEETSRGTIWNALTDYERELRDA